jgi:hypothetical protein
MSTELLKEVLMPFSTKQLEVFNEATANCTDEQRLAVAKRMSEEKLPGDYRFTESQIKRFVTQESLSRLNWYPGIEINNGTATGTTDDRKIDALKERQYNAYRKSGMNESEASATSGFTPKAA